MFPLNTAYFNIFVQGFYHMHIYVCVFVQKPFFSIQLILLLEQAYTGNPNPFSVAIKEIIGTESTLGLRKPYLFSKFLLPEHAPK